MGKVLKLFLVLIFTSSFFTNQVLALKISINGVEKTMTETDLTSKKNICSRDVFYFFSRFFEKTTPESYKYIDIKFKGIGGDIELKKALQILVYNNKIPNLEKYLASTKSIKAYDFYRLSNLILGVDISNVNVENLLKRNVNYNDLNLIKKSYYLINEKKKEEARSMIERNNLFENIYTTIKKSHYNKENIKDADLVYSAIEGLAKGTKDKHTIFFPPSKNKDFKQSLTGNFEGIGAYVELSKPGFFVIQTPIPGSPAEKSGLKGGDRIIKVDDNEITENNPSEEIISWIKGKAGTKVKLTVLRGKEKIEINVIRAKIHINNIDYEIKNNGIYYIKIKNFGQNVSEEFSEILKEIDGEIGIKKIIFDLRNNGGGFLNEVTEMLSGLVSKGEKTAVIKYHEGEKVYTSAGYDYLDLSNYKVVILQNSGTASASEIMIGTLKDYFPNIVIIGEKSYGKGSVQTIRSYVDGSSFKYTIAKWFTGKTETGIDGVGIKPDINIELDIEEYNKYEKDNQLEEAINY